jgi:hypothetical protein
MQFLSVTFTKTFLIDSSSQIKNTGPLPYKISDYKISFNFQQIRWQIASMTFVIMNRANIDVQALTKMLPNAKFIDWDVEKTDVPDEWEKYFLDAYGCESKIPYPCNHNILFAYDATLNTADLQVISI